MEAYKLLQQGGRCNRLSPYSRKVCQQSLLRVHRWGSQGRGGGGEDLGGTKEGLGVRNIPLRERVRVAGPVGRQGGGENDKNAGGNQG